MVIAILEVIHGLAPQCSDLKPSMQGFLGEFISPLGTWLCRRQSLLYSCCARARSTPSLALSPSGQALRQQGRVFFAYYSAFRFAQSGLKAQTYLFLAAERASGRASTKELAHERVRLGSGVA